MSSDFENLPSIDDFTESLEELPLVTELLRLVNDLKESIPEIPEIKSYDNELQELLTHIEEVRRVFRRYQR